MKIPLWGMVTAAGIGMFTAAGMYFTMSAQTDAIKDLQITVKSGNSSVVAVTGELTLQKFRLTKAEDDIKRNSESILILQQRGNK